MGRRIAGRRGATRLLLTVVALTAACVVAPNAGAVVARIAKNQLAGVWLQRQVKPSSLRGSFDKLSSASVSTVGDVNYHGGPVLHATTPYLIFWDPTGHPISAGDKTLLERFFNDAAADSGKASNQFGVLRQYGDSTGIANYSQTWSSAHAIDDTDAYPLSGSQCKENAGFTEHACLFDSQIQAEVQHEITLNGLPTGVGGNAPVYFVVLPPDVNTCFDSGSTICADNVFCAYHSNLAANNTTYANIPLIGAAQDPKACQFDGNPGVQAPNFNPTTDVATSYISHEDSETITDPLLNAWYSDTTGNEVGDNCAFAGPFNPAQGENPDAWLPTLGGSASTGSLFDELINGDEYYTQTEWSNGNGACEARPAATTLSPDFSGSELSGNTVELDPSSSASSAGISSDSWSFGDGATAFSTGNAPIEHTYPARGTYSVTLTQVDNYGNLTTATRQVTAGSVATARIVAAGSPIGGGAPASLSGASSGDIGSFITSYSWNLGDGQSPLGPAVSHRYRKAGTYTATLTVTDASGATSSTAARINVAPSKITKVRVKKSKTVEKLTVTVNGAGTVKFGSRRFKSSGPKNLTIRVKLTNAQRSRLRINHSLTLRIKLKYLPAGGKSSSKPVTIKLKG